MRISKRGLDLIKEFEGYHTALKNGDCKAYRCPAGVWTIGWGSTEGVKEGMRWTREEAEAALVRELATHEEAVNKYVTRDLTQEQFDALVSFSYNVGIGNLRKSTMLKILNRGDDRSAALQLLRWNKHRDPKRGGLVESRGLTRRRKAEMDLFLSAPSEPPKKTERMPQAAAPETLPITPALKSSWTITGALTVALGATSSWAVEGVKYVTDVSDQLGQLTGIGVVLGKIGVDAKAIGLAIVVAGAVIVIQRRLSAAREGKVG